MYTTVGVGQVLSYILPVRLNIEKKPWAIFKETTLFMVVKFDSYIITILVG